MTECYRMRPTTRQGAAMVQHCADARFVWNLALEQFNLYRPGHPTPNRSERQRQLAEARRWTWLGEGSSSVQQAALRDFDRAATNWWAGTHRRPTWRKRDINEGFSVRDLCVKYLGRKWATVFVPKVGPVRFRLSRPLPECKSARVTLDRCGRWHISFIAPQPTFARTFTGVATGVDMGIAASVTTSAGEHQRMPTLLSPGETQRKRRLERQMARQRNGSNRRGRTKCRIARLSAREVDRRKDWIEKTTTDLVRAHDLIAIEDLRVRNMTRRGVGKRGLNRVIHGQAWGVFRKRLVDKAGAASSPTVVVAVNPANTSRRCYACNYVASESRESQARFRCVRCGYAANADVNAAQNILAAGYAVAGRGGTPHASAQRPCEASTTQARA